MNGDCNGSSIAQELEAKRRFLADLKALREQRIESLAALKAASLDSSSATLNPASLDTLVSSIVSSLPPSESVSAKLGNDNDSEPFEHQRPNLTLDTECMLFDAPPVERITYSKQVQTAETETSCDDLPIELEQLQVSHETKPEELVVPVEVAPPVSVQTSPSPPPTITVLTQEEADTIMETPEFHDFFSKSSRWIERALDDPYDLLIDYGDEHATKKSVDAGQGLSLDTCYEAEEYTRSRFVADIDFSPKFSELVLGTYRRRAGTEGEDDGCLLVWNQHSPSRPEYVFTAQSEITKASFVEYAPHLIVGGSVSGQILLWDLRAKSQPVLKSVFSGQGHAHPVTHLSMLGSENAHHLLSSSADGRVCLWQLDMLSHPIEALDLVHPHYARADQMGITCLGVRAGEAATLWIGTEEGAMYQVNRFDRAGSKAGLDPTKVYTGHQTHISSLSFHPGVSPLSSTGGHADFSDLVLTSSFDWTVKLWKIKNSTDPTTGSHKIEPLLSFDDFDEYVYDVAWSPVAPSVFGCIDGNGSLLLYDLLQSTEAPVLSRKVSSMLTKMQWRPKGAGIALGSNDGKLQLFDLKETRTPEASDSTRFQQLLSSLRG